MNTTTQASLPAGPEPLPAPPLPAPPLPAPVRGVWPVSYTHLTLPTN